MAQIGKADEMVCIGVRRLSPQGLRYHKAAAPALVRRNAAAGLFT